MSDAATLRRQLKIKTGSAKRLYKEHRMYEKEVEQLKVKLDKFVADNAEEWDVKNTRRMIEESGKMITDSATRLGTVMQELRDLVLAAEHIPELEEDEDLVKARETMEEISV